MNPTNRNPNLPSARPLGSEMGGELIFLDYRLQRAGEDLELLQHNLEAIQRKIAELRRKLSLNAAGEPQPRKPRT